MGTISEDHVTELRERMSANDTEHAAFNRRLEVLEKADEERTKILLQLQEQGSMLRSIGESVKSLADGVGKIDERVRKIETEPADKWRMATRKVMELILAAIVGGIIAYIASGGV